jgi:hypothetical protein
MKTARRIADTSSFSPRFEADGSFGGPARQAAPAVACGHNFQKLGRKKKGHSL